MQTTRQAFQFFHAHAGFVVGKRAIGALALTRAEQWARDAGVDFVWEYDTLPWDADDNCPPPSEVLVCRAVLDGHTLALLGGIGDPDRAYTRVVEAELAMEAIATLETERKAAVTRGIW